MFCRSFISYFYQEIFIVLHVLLFLLCAEEVGSSESLVMCESIRIGPVFDIEDDKVEIVVDRESIPEVDGVQSSFLKHGI